jgi:two-component system nitrogen regulation sensor histidine kinase NtrY
MPLLSEQSRRKRNLLVIGGVLVLLVIATAFEFGIRTPDIPVGSGILVFALFNLNLIVLLLLLVLLFRNLVKLSFERRQNVIGSRFKAKLVLAFLSLALAPAILIFIIASNFINTSIEGWFKPQVERPLDQALAVAQTYYQSLEATALRHGQHLARVIVAEDLLDPARQATLRGVLADRQRQLGFSAATVFDRRGRRLAHVTDPAVPGPPAREISEQQVRQGLAGHDVTTVHEVPEGDLIQAVASVRPDPGRPPLGAVVVTIQVAQRLESKVRDISRAFTEYKQLKLLKNPIKGIYILMFLLMTLIIVFSFTWLGLYLARGITVPIEQLVAGTREVAAGNLAYRVEARADDEIGMLVDSFNRMTGDLAQSKTRLEAAYLDLQAKHAELEARRRYTETVLEAVATGVVSFDIAGRLTTMNRAAVRMLGLATVPRSGQSIQSVFAGPDLADLVGLALRASRGRVGTTERELRFRRDGVAVTLLASATALAGPDGEEAGVVLVLEDLTELLRAQRLAAWREVAQRIAHEIKNPLTPIQLSAQRLRRRLAGRASEETRLVEECTGTIIQEVDGLKRLVDEFSRFARMPALAPRPTDLRGLIEAVLALYHESNPGVSLSARYGEDLPPLAVDPDQIKRAILNLVDNAVDAVHGLGTVEIELANAPETGSIRLTVTDDGPGIATENRETLFQPYFSTKPTGTGLGLSIVHQIVSDHAGRIWVEDHHPRGTRFVIELPAAGVPAAVPT